MTKRSCIRCGHPAERHMGEVEPPQGADHIDMRWVAKLMGVYRECGGDNVGDDECECGGYV